MTEEEYYAIPLDQLIRPTYGILRASDWNYVASYLILLGCKQVAIKTDGAWITREEWYTWQHIVRSYLDVVALFNSKETWDRHGWPLDEVQWNAVVTAVYQRRHAEVVA